MVSSRLLLAAITAALPVSLAATCNPLTDSCSADPAQSETTFTTDWTKSSQLGDGWSTTDGSIGFGSNGAEFVIQKQGDAPTIQADGYIFFGKVEVKIQAAPGQGIVSSIVLVSDVGDEIDWEFTGTNVGQVQTNYFGKGNISTYDRAIWYPVASPQTNCHTYTIDWSSTAITWYIDGTAVRTLNAADANGGSNYPQSPCRVRIGIWAGGDPTNSQGTISWAGGPTDYGTSYSMYVEYVTITNASPGASYTYTDRTGSVGSINVGSPKAGSGGTSTGDTITGPSGTTMTPPPSVPVASSISASTDNNVPTDLHPLGSASAPAASSGSGIYAPASNNSAASSGNPVASANPTAETGTGGFSGASTNAASSAHEVGNAAGGLVMIILTALCLL